MRSMDERETVSRTFFEQNTLTVARGLLGLTLAFEHGPGDLRLGRIVETEAYMGPDDRASHASRGRTPRSAIMFEQAGAAYVYLIYGFHHCLNVVTEQVGFPAAVLIRAVEPILGLEGRTDGPGRVCRAYGIDRSMNGTDMTGPPLYFLAEADALALDIASGPRVGVAYAGEWAARPWRFWIRGSQHVSRPAARTIGAQATRQAQAEGR